MPMTEELIACPRCNKPLLERTVGTAAIEACDACQGLLVEQKHLVPLLSFLSKNSADVLDLDHPPEAVADSNPPIPCPDCEKTMQRFGYMESRLVMLDRCNACWLVWIDDGELPPMVHMHARLTRQTDTHFRERQELADHLSRLVFISNSGA